MKKNIHTRKSKRDILRQIISFQNLAQRPDFQKDLVGLRSKYKVDIEETKKTWVLIYKTRVDKAKKNVFEVYMERYGFVGAFNIQPPIKNGTKRRLAIDLLAKNFRRVPPKIIKNFSQKWCIRYGDSWAIIFGDDYPPYFWGNAYRVADYGSAKFSRKPIVKRSWWVHRVRRESIADKVWATYKRGVKPPKILDYFPDEVVVTYDAIKKLFKEKKKK